MASLAHGKGATRQVVLRSTLLTISQLFPYSSIFNIRVTWCYMVLHDEWLWSSFSFNLISIDDEPPHSWHFLAQPISALDLWSHPHELPLKRCARSISRHRAIMLTYVIMWKYVEICGNMWKYVEICGNMWKYVEWNHSSPCILFSSLFYAFLSNLGFFANSAEKLKISSSVIGRDGNGHADDGPL